VSIMTMHCARQTDDEDDGADNTENKMHGARPALNGADGTIV
jgi:hypothetical protein